MPAPTSSLFDHQSQAVEEVINKSVDHFMPALDPCFQDSVVSSQGVGPASALGRDMKILKLYRGGMSGVIEGGRPRNDVTLYGDQTTAYGEKLFNQELIETWPNAQETPKSTMYPLGIPMRSLMTNYMTTLGELQAEALPAFIGDVVTPGLVGFGQNIAHTMCNYWYVSQNDSYQLDVVADVSISSRTITFSPGNEAVDRFAVGQRVDFINSAGSLRKNDTAGAAAQTLGTRINCLVVAVDELTNTVTVESDPGAAAPTAWNGASGTVANGDKVVYANSGLPGASTAVPFTGIAGINSWLKTGAGSNDNYLLGAERYTGETIDVTVHPEFKSFSKDLNGAVLTEHQLGLYLRRFHQAKGKYGMTIDTVIASDGVWKAYLAQKIGQFAINRTGQTQSLSSEGETGELVIVEDGRSYRGKTSTYIEKGTVYGIKQGGNNWKRYVPPTPKGATDFDQAPSFAPFKFIMPSLTGSGSAKWPIQHSSGNYTQITEGVQMPGMLRMQLAPDQAAGMKLTNCATDKVFSDN